MQKDEAPFDVVAKSGGGTVTLLRGATFDVAVARAKVEAKQRRRGVTVINQATGATQVIEPDKG
jgi:hypothetical protein